MRKVCYVRTEGSIIDIGKKLLKLLSSAAVDAEVEALSLLATPSLRLTTRITVKGSSQTFFLHGTSASLALE